MNKIFGRRSRGGVMIGVVAAIIVAAAGVIAVLAMRSGVGGSAHKAEDALPQYDAASSHFVMGVRDVSGVSGAISFASRVIGSSSAVSSLGLPDAASELGDVDELSAVAVSLLDRLGAYVSAADDFAVLSAGDDIVVSFFSTEEKFAKLLDEMRADGTLAIWEADIAKGGEAYRWAIEGEAERLSEVFIVKRADGSRVHVSAASSEDAVRRSAAAWGDEKLRAKIDRKLTSPNYIISRFASRTIDGGSTENMVESAWRRDGKRTVIDVENDLSVSGIKPITSGVEDVPIPMYGAGEPTLMFASDIPMILSHICPGAEDPAEAVLALGEKIAGSRVPAQFRGTVKKLLMSSRITCAVFMKKDDPMPSSSYVVIDTKDASPLMQFLPMAALFMSREDVSGWKDFYSTDLDGVKVVLGSSDGRVLLGTGEPSEFAKAASKPAEMKGVPDKGVLSLCYLATKFITDKSTALGEMVSDMLGDEPEAASVYDALKSVRSVLSVQTAPNKAQTVVEWSD